MDNHYHLIIHTPIGNLSHVMHYINSIFARYINSELKRKGPLFGGRYHAILMNDEAYLLRGVRYIHRNPIEAKVVSDLSCFEWSSFIDYIYKEKNAWLYTYEVEKRFKKLNFTGTFADYTNINDKEVTILFENLKYNSKIVGNEDISSLFEFLDKQQLVQDYVYSKDIMKLYKPPSIDLIIDITALYFHMLPVELCSRKSLKRKDIPRRVAIYLARTLAKCTQGEIRSKFRDVNISAISTCYHRAQRDPLAIKSAKNIELIIKKCREIKSI